MITQGMDTSTRYTEPEEATRPLMDEPQEEPAAQVQDEEDEEHFLFEGWEEDFLNAPWLKRNWLFILFVIACGLVSIAWPYVYMIKLQDIRYKSLFISAERIEYERIGNILDRVGEYRLPLVPASQPPDLLLDTGQYASSSPKE